MPTIDYEKLETRRVGGVDRHGMISLLRGKLGNERIEVSATPSHPVVIHEEAAE